MSSEKTSFEDDPAPDPFEAELVAYLDGELDPVAAHKVETRLANDPDARARATELKKSFDLLDYLPRPEPSTTFTTRTLDKLPAIKSTTSSNAGSRQPPQTASSVSTSMPIPLDSEPLPTPRMGTGTNRSPVWIAGGFAALIAFVTLGYLATAVARPYLFSSREKEPEDIKNELDARVIEHLHLYAVADDIEFVNELATPEHFGEDPSVAFDPTLRIPTTDTGIKPPVRDLDTLTKTSARFHRHDKRKSSNSTRSCTRRNRRNATGCFAFWKRTPRGWTGCPTPSVAACWSLQHPACGSE